MKDKRKETAKAFPASQLYDFDEARGIWLRRTKDKFHYSDGDATEEGIALALRKVGDRSVFSEELKALQTNWAATYYFSANRANLLRPLAAKLLRGARVLELGCGMGAITRYLGETCAEVCAVEGSARRGAAAALRCADLDNVHVIIDEIKNLPESLGKFDVVTLIGVLEYSRRYGGPGAEVEVLRKARTFLADKGVLVLALENKLGLKYLGGVAEDHLLRPWVGVTNGYDDNGVCTWSRKELVEMMRQAGFEHHEQFVPLPDYKLPSTIITPEGLGSGRLNLEGILNNPGRLYENKPVFNIGEVWKSVYRAGLLPDLADSLCFVASAEKRESPFEKDVLVVHYGRSAILANNFAKEVKIVDKDGELLVERKRLFPDLESKAREYRQILVDEPFINGAQLFDRVSKTVMRPGWTLDEFYESLRPWLELLLQDMDANGFCDGALLDLTPFNIIMEGDQARPFDLEWACENRVPITFILYRGLHHTVWRLLPLRKSNGEQPAMFSQIWEGLLKKLSLPEGIEFTPDYLRWQETKFLRALRPKNVRLAPAGDFPIFYAP